jgi:large subunit ribosomal protein L37Ae
LLLALNLIWGYGVAWLAYEVWDFMTPVQIRVAPFQKLWNVYLRQKGIKMTTKSKKTKSAGRFGARYVKKVKDRLVKVEEKQRKKQVCPFCKKPGVKRKAKGIWECKKCGKTFAGNTYNL